MTDNTVRVERTAKWVNLDTEETSLEVEGSSHLAGGQVPGRRRRLGHTLVSPQGPMT